MKRDWSKTVSAGPSVSSVLLRLGGGEEGASKLFHYLHAFHDAAQASVWDDNQTLSII